MTNLMPRVLLLQVTGRRLRSDGLRTMLHAQPPAPEGEGLPDVAFPYYDSRLAPECSAEHKIALPLAE